MDSFIEIRGVAFDVDEALRQSPLRDFAESWRRGAAVGSSDKLKFPDSGFSVCVGRGDDCDLAGQIADAMKFLQAESCEILRIRALPGVDKACLRFGEIWPEGIVSHSPRLPSHLLLACGQLGLEIVLCQYLGSGVSEDNDKDFSE